MKRPVITLLTDFGHSDYYVAAMKGVILGICGEAQIIDITHNVAPFQITQGAWLLKQAWKTFPAGTIHVAVVDPGVGSERKPILAQAGGHLWLAPDNGLLWPALEDLGPSVVREVTASHLFRQPVSETFHGRDIFAPIAAHLAVGLDPAAVGPLIEKPAHLPPLLNVEIKGEWRGTVLWVDTFGNVVTSFDAAEFAWVSEVPAEMTAGSASIRKCCKYYRQIPTDEAALVKGSAGFLEISINQQNAARTLGLAPGSGLSLRRV